MSRKDENRKKEGKPESKPRVHQDLNGFQVSINEFGEILANMDIEKINQFLDKNVDDKKLVERNDTADQPKKAKSGKKKMT